MKNIFLAGCLVTVCIFSACTKGGEPEGFSGDMYVVTAALDGSKAVPATANDTTKGTITGLYDEQANILTFTLSYRKDTTIYKKDTLTNIYLFKQKPAAAGAAFLKSMNFTVNIDATTKPNPINVSGSLNLGVSGNTQFTNEEKAGFLAGSWYALLISKRFPNGVAGGQLSAVKK